MLKSSPNSRLDFLSQPIMPHPADEVGAQLRRTLLGADDFQPRLAFGLESIVRQKSIASSSVMLSQCIL